MGYQFNLSRSHEIWDVKGHSDFLARQWGGPECDRGRHWELLRSIVDLVRSKNILEAGCGMGHFYYLLKKYRPEVQYRGFDNSIEMLNKAWEFFPEEKDRDKFFKADIYNLAELEPAETVVCIDVLMHLPDTLPALRQVWSKARSELIITFRLDPKGFCHERPYSGETVLPEGKKLIIKALTLSDIFSSFGCLEDIYKVEVFYYDDRTSVFRLERGISRYASFRNGWSKR